MSNGFAVSASTSGDQHQKDLLSSQTGMSILCLPVLELVSGFQIAPNDKDGNPNTVISLNGTILPPLGTNSEHVPMEKTSNGTLSLLSSSISDLTHIT